MGGQWAGLGRVSSVCTVAHHSFFLSVREAVTRPLRRAVVERDARSNRQAAQLEALKEKYPANLHPPSKFPFSNEPFTALHMAQHSDLESKSLEAL